MQPRAVLPLLASLVAVASAGADEASPLSTVLKLLNDLKTKVEKDAAVESKAYEDFTEWCSVNSRNLNYDIKTLSMKKQKSEAALAKSMSNVQAAATKIDQLISEISRVEAEQENAKRMREKEIANFKENEADLVNTIDETQKAIEQLRRVADATNGAGFVQMETPKLEAVLHSLETLSEAAAVEGDDIKQLASLVQSAADDSSGTKTISKENGILSMLENMNEKMTENLEKTRAADVKAAGQYDLLKLSLGDERTSLGRDLDDTRGNKAESEGAAAAAQSELKRADATLKETTDALQASNDRCLQTAADHEVVVRDRTAEMTALTEALNIISEGTAGLRKRKSMLQLGSSTRAFFSSRDRSRLAGGEIATIVRRLAETHHSKTLEQLASRITTVLKLGSHGGQDPFAKVKSMIQSLIARLQAQAQSDANEKAFCDQETAKTNGKRDDLDAFIGKKTTQIDQTTAKSTSLKEEVREAQASLASLAKTQAEMDRVRAENNAAYKVSKNDLELGISGVRRGIEILQKYYSASDASFVQDSSSFDLAVHQPAVPQHDKSGDSANSIQKILELVESDMAKNLAETEAQESEEVDAYETTSQDNRVMKETLEQDVLYKTREFKAADKVVSSAQADRDTSATERAAVEEYAAKLRERCTTLPEKYVERKSRRDAEIAGLREALSMLEGDAELLQQRRSRRLRGQ